MVNFETEVYNRQDDDVIGVKVIVVADNGQTIESIRCVNETDFQHLKEQLDVLDESYVEFAENSSLAGLNIDTILANTNETATINATNLGGLQSDAYAKSNHTHKKSNITDLYNFDISLSKYNVTLTDVETVNVTVKVTNSTNSPVNKETISIYKNGELWKSNVKTNSNGVYTATFTPDDEGIVTFAVNNQKVQLNVKPGWKTIYSGTYGKIKTNGELVSLYFKSATKTIGTANWVNMGDLSSIGVASKYYPPYIIYQKNNGNVDVRLTSKGKLEACSRGSSSKYQAAEVYAVYLLQELHL